jgi:hypothetical protein
MVSSVKTIHQRRMSTYAASILSQAQAALLSTVRTQVQSGTNLASLVPPGAASANPAGVAASGWYSESISPCPSTCTFTGTAYFTESGSTSGGTGSTSVNAENENSTLSEGRVSFEVVAQVALNGTVIATRTETVTYRTFAELPYVVAVGALDFGGSAQAASEGDVGGCNPAAIASCDAAGTSTFDDTRAHVNATCATADDPTECTYAAANGYAPTDNFHTNAWQTNDASSNEVAR